MHEARIASDVLQDEISFYRGVCRKLLRWGLGPVINPFSVKSSPHVSITIEEDGKDEHLYYRQGQSFHEGGDQLFEKAVSTCVQFQWTGRFNCLFTS